MGFFFKSKTTLKEECLSSIWSVTQYGPDDANLYFNICTSGDIKNFDKARKQFGPDEAASSILLMDALYADCSNHRGIKVPTDYQNDTDSIVRRYEMLKDHLKNKEIFDEEDHKTAKVVGRLFVAKAKKPDTLSYLGCFYKMRPAELIPAEFMDDYGQKLLEKDKYGAFLLYDEYADVPSALQGKINFTVAKILLENGSEDFNDHIIMRIRKAVELGYRDPDGLMDRLLGEPEEGSEEVDEVRMRERLEDADKTYAESGDPQVYVRLFKNGLDKYESGKPREIAFEAAIRYSDAVDQISAAGGIQEDKIEMLYEQRRLHVLLAGNGYKEYYGRAADAFRDGYGYIPQKLDAARIFYGRAADEGDRHALLYCGIFCKDGLGGGVDGEGARDLFYSLLKNGPEDIYAGRACYNLGQMFAEGIGFDKEPENARTFFDLAAQFGWDDETQKLHELRAKLGGYLKEMGDNPQVLAEIAARIKDPDTNSIVLPPMI